MPLEAQLTIDRTDLLLQESPSCKLTLKNTGRTSLTAERGPVLRTVDVKTGAESLFEKRGKPWVAAKPQPLTPGQSQEVTFNLLERVALPAPGQFEISAYYELKDGAGRVESPPVRVTVRPATARNLSLVNVQGGASSVLYGAWINLAADPPEVVRSRFEVVPGGGVTPLQTIAKATLQTRPILSAPANGNVVNSHWVGWLEGASLRITHSDESMPAAPIGKLDLPSSDWQIVEPLHSDPIKDTRVRPNGAALFWGAAPDGKSSRLQVVQLSPSGAALGPSTDLPLLRPRWCMSHARSRGARLLTFIHASDDAATLQIANWPDADGAKIAPRKLTEWKALFLAAGATMNADDTILGSLLAWTSSGTTQRLELIDWTIDREGKFADGERHVIDWPPGVPINDAIVRVSGRGYPAAVARAGDGRCYFIDKSGTAATLPGRFAATRLPVELAFLGGVEPVLIVAEEGLGFRLMRTDGSALPPPPW